MEPDDPFEEEQEALGRHQGYPTPPLSDDVDEEPRHAGAADEVGPSPRRPGQATDVDAEPRNTDAAEAEPEPCRPGLQPKLNTVLCREASDVAPRVGTFTRAEASLLYEGTTYNWPMAEEEDGFDGAGPFLISRMQTCIANATGAHFQAFSDAIHPEHTTGFETTRPIVKALPDAPRDHRPTPPDS